MIKTGIIANIIHPGKLWVKIRKITNSVKIIKKLRKAETETIIGKHILGKFIFLKHWHY